MKQMVNNPFNVPTHGRELSKVVAKQAEEGRVAIRNIRRDAIKAYDKLEKV
ncbi:hypothetical protein R6Q57_017453 [Mikania cordata]